MKRIITILALILFSNAAGFSAETGIASFYSIKSNRGTVTASGIPLCDNKLTAAHKKYRFGTIVKVTDIKTNKHVTVKITDRGPFIRGRIIDLSHRAAHELGIKKRGIAKVKVEAVKHPTKKQ